MADLIDRAESADSGTPGIQPGGGGARPTSALFDRSWRSRSWVEHLSAERDGDGMISNHYLAQWPGTRVCVLGMSVGGALVGIVVFSLPPREVSRRYGAPAWELSRLWIDDAVPRNGESWLLAQAVRHVKRAHAGVGCLVSYADPSQGHTGGVYRAAGWRADGWTDQGRLVPRSDYIDQRTGKKYGRRAHVPSDAVIRLVRRTSKYRFFLRLPCVTRIPEGEGQ